MDKCICCLNGSWLVGEQALLDQTPVYLPGTNSLRRFTAPSPLNASPEVLLDPAPVLVDVYLASLLEPGRITRWSDKPRIWWHGCYEVPDAVKRQNLDLLLPDGTILRPQWASEGAVLKCIGMIGSFTVARRLEP
ncbi:MAG: hypothetical protein K2W95_28660 [Candidatus Obscuribacterales bacterium]|nr:hypothetical protein [Candidatus Obscuribacterales bacterium]